MIDETLRAFLERGCAMIVGTVGADGTPHAQRAWGCTVVDEATVRLLVDGADPTLREHLDGGRIAVTAADVRTLRSVQLKGRVAALEEEPTAEDLRRCGIHNDEVFTDIESTLGVVYGSAVNTAGVTETLLMDVFEPAGDTVTSRPTVMWIHGGGFYLGGTGELERDTFYELVRRGYVVASISYRLIPAPGCSGGPVNVCIDGMNDAREDAQTAIRYLKANAAAYGIDTSRIAVAGTSAGATTALHTGYEAEETPDAAPTVPR